MKNKFLLAAMLLPLCLHAQWRHDLKVDVFQGFLSTAILHYEVSKSNHFGVEFGLGHRWSEIAVNTIPSTNTYARFDQNIGVASLAARFYPSKRAQTDRFYIGAYLWEEYLLKQESGYKEAFLETFGFEPANNRNLRTALGGSLGFKRVYKNRILIEIGFRMDANLAAIIGKGDDAVLDISGYVEGRVGYRFGKERVVVPE